MAGWLPADESTVMGRHFKKCADIAKEYEENVEKLKVSSSEVRKFREKRISRALDSEDQQQEDVALRSVSEIILKEKILQLRGELVSLYRGFYELVKSQFCVKKNCQPIWVGERCALCTHTSKFRWVKARPVVEICGASLAWDIARKARRTIAYNGQSEKAILHRLDDILGFITEKESSKAANDTERQLVSSNAVWR